MNNLKNKNLNRPIVLIGLSGAGKTSVGLRLAKKLKLKFYDSDRIIEKQCQATIAEIFERQGQKYFRGVEKLVIENLLGRKSKKMVIALGGGSIENRETKKLVLSSCVVIFLSCSLEQIYRRLKNKTDRPLMSGKNGRRLTRSELIQKIKFLLGKRESDYLKADIKVSTSNRTETEIVKLIIAKLKEAK